MVDNRQDPLQRRKWNFSALTGVAILTFVNIVAAIGFLTGKMTFQDWAAVTGSINGMALGWVTKNLSE